MCLTSNPSPTALLKSNWRLKIFFPGKSDSHRLDEAGTDNYTPNSDSGESEALGSEAICPKQ
jgi:hypothetical protein